MVNWVLHEKFETSNTASAQFTNNKNPTHPKTPQPNPSSSNSRSRNQSRGAARSPHVPCAAVQQLSAAFRILPSNATRANLLRWTPPTRRRSGSLWKRRGSEKRTATRMKMRHTHLHILGKCCQTFLTGCLYETTVGGPHTR